MRYINPDSLNKNPAFSNVVVEGNVKTVHIGGQDAVDASGEIVGKGDIAAQTEQVLANVRAALAAGGAGPGHVIKWTIYIVEGQPLQVLIAVLFEPLRQRIQAGVDKLSDKLAGGAGTGETPQREPDTFIPPPSR